MFYAEKNIFKEKEVKSNQDCRSITLVTHPKIFDIANLHEIIPTGTFKY